MNLSCVSKYQNWFGWNVFFEGGIGSCPQCKGVRDQNLKFETETETLSTGSHF